MPTYVKRAGISGVIEEHGVSVASTTDAVQTDRILTETLFQFSDASGYVVGETMTEDTSGVTGIVYWVDLADDTVGVVDCSDEFDGDKALLGSVSATNKTPTACYNRLEKTAETPSYTQFVDDHELTSTGGSDPKIVYLSERTDWFVIDNVVGATVTVNNDATANILDAIAAGEKRAFNNTDRNVQTLYLEFSAAGSCTVIEYRGHENPLTLVEPESIGSSLAGIEADIATVAANTTSLDAKEGTTGEAADVNGTRAGQLRYIGEKAEEARVLLAAIDADTATIAGDTTEIAGKITQLARTYGYEQPAITDDAQIVHDVSVKIPPKAKYTSPTDFTATFTSNVTLTLAALGITITDASQIKYIKQINASNNVFTLVNGINGVTFTEVADVVTIVGAGTPLTAGDVYDVGIDEQDKGYDATNSLWKTQEQSPLNQQYTDPVGYTEFTPDDVTYDEGDVISVTGYKTVTLYWTKTASNADDTLIKLIGLTEAGGTSDYQEMSMGNPTGGITPLTSNVYKIDKASGVNYKVFDVKGLNYCRFDMAKATNTGTNATLTTLISKEY